MPAYFVAELDTTNPAGMEPYRAAVPATIAQYGGRYVTRGGATQLVEGGPEPKRIVILEFADTAAVKRWYHSPEYQKILPMRLNNSTGRAFIVEGASYSPGAAAAHYAARKVGPEILAGVARLARGDIFRGAGGDDMAASIAAFGAEIDDPVGGLDDL